MSETDRRIGLPPVASTSVQLPECHTAVEMQAPPVVVILRHSWGDKKQEDYVGLALQENGVRVEVERVDLKELAEDIAKAKAWLADPTRDPDG